MDTTNNINANTGISRRQLIGIGAPRRDMQVENALVGARLPRPYEGHEPDKITRREFHLRSIFAHVASYILPGLFSSNIITQSFVPQLPTIPRPSKSFLFELLQYKYRKRWGGHFIPEGEPEMPSIFGWTPFTSPAAIKGFHIREHIDLLRNVKNRLGELEMAIDTNGTTLPDSHAQEVEYGYASMFTEFMPQQKKHFAECAYCQAHYACRASHGDVGFKYEVQHLGDYISASQKFLDMYENAPLEIWAKQLDVIERQIKDVHFMIGANGEEFCLSGSQMKPKIDGYLTFVSQMKTVPPSQIRKWYVDAIRENMEEARRLRDELKPLVDFMFGGVERESQGALQPLVKKLDAILTANKDIAMSKIEESLKSPLESDLPFAKGKFILLRARWETYPLDDIHLIHDVVKEKELPVVIEDVESFVEQDERFESNILEEACTIALREAKQNPTGRLGIAVGNISGDREDLRFLRVFSNYIHEAFPRFNLTILGSRLHKRQEIFWGTRGHKKRLYPAWSDYFVKWGKEDTKGLVIVNPERRLSFIDVADFKHWHNMKKWELVTQ